jgi:putative CocE/NonD family hydrolase
MSDADRDSDAWVLPPSRYLAQHPPRFASTPPASCYVTMRDGCRIAVDVYLPGGGPARVPCVLILTPYYRRFALASDAPGAARWRDLLVGRGYGLVVVDVRGTGASFGARDSFRSPREREDYGELAAWIVEQPWSDGRIGATGISYVGAACDFLASTGHPAVRAIAPLFAVWDTYADHYYPGGILLHRLAENYDRLMVALDHDDREQLLAIGYNADPAYRGPAPVDGDNGALRDAAIAEHRGNFRMPDFITEFRFREEPLPYDPSFSSASFSPYKYAATIPEDVAVLSVSGWMDGAGYANGAIARFLTLPNCNKHLLIGPWDHGARVNVSPWRGKVAPEFVLEGELLRFFDTYLMQRETGLEHEAPVHVFAMHAEHWRAHRGWPVAPLAQRLMLAADGELADLVAEPGGDAMRADFAAGTGTKTRYERLAAENTLDYYPDWQGRDDAMLRWQTAPLDGDQTLIGHAVLDLWLDSSETDAAIHAYLSEVEADGTVRYVTEGVLRALHRRESPPPPNYKAAWPFRTYARADAAPLKPGTAERMRVVLLPTGWTFRAGSRIRLSIAGADVDHYAQVPHGRPPMLRVHRGGAHASALELPLMPG